MFNLPIKTLTNSQHCRHVLMTVFITFTYFCEFLITIDHLKNLNFLSLQSQLYHFLLQYPTHFRILIFFTRKLYVGGTMFARLKELREFEGVTQEEIASYLKISRSTYAGYESGKDMIPLEKLNMVANYFQTSLDYLVGESPSRDKILEVQSINKQNVSKTIKKIRKENHLTQKEFANSLKTSQSNIHKYEKEKALITTYYALEFSKQYHYSLDKLVGRKKNN